SLRIMIHSIVPPLPRHGYAPSTISAVRVDRMVRMHRRIERWRSGVSWLPLPAGLGLHRLEYRKELGILIEIHRAIFCVTDHAQARHLVELPVRKPDQLGLLCRSHEFGLAIGSKLLSHSFALRRLDVILDIRHVLERGVHMRRVPPLPSLQRTQELSTHWTGQLGTVITQCIDINHPQGDRETRGRIAWLGDVRRITWLRCCCHLGKQQARSDGKQQMSTARVHGHGGFLPRRHTPMRYSACRPGKMWVLAAFLVRPWPSADCDVRFQPPNAPNAPARRSHGTSATPDESGR